MLKEVQRRGPLHQQPLSVRAKAGEDEVLWLPRLIKGRDHVVTGADQIAGACQDFVQDGIKVEA